MTRAVVKMVASSGASSSSAPPSTYSCSSVDTPLNDPCSSNNVQDSESDGDRCEGREEKEVASLLVQLATYHTAGNFRG